MMLRALLALALASAASFAQSDPYDDFARDILRELVEVRSSAPHPENTVRLIETLAERFRKEGFAAEDVLVVPADNIAGLFVRLQGTGKRKPLLTMAHVDVVDADPAAWKADPFHLTEIDGYYYGRGTTDNKAGAAVLITNFIRLKREGYRPDRDLLLVLTGDEETGAASIKSFTEDRPELIAAELAFNTDSGGGRYGPEDKPELFSIQMSEKVYQSFELEATNPGGHSSRPRRDNAIYQLAHALTRIETYRFPVVVNEVVRESFRVQAETAEPARAELLRAAANDPPDPEAVRRLAAEDSTINASVRTTCVATMLQAGVAENALPRSAKALVNCRILPGVAPETVLATLREVIADDEIRVTPKRPASPSPPSPLREDVLGRLKTVAAEFWGPVPMAPYQSTGATDGLYVRKVGIPVYGFSGLFDREGESRAHGLDERVRVDSFHRSVKFWYRLLKDFSQ